jgi:hypothetical protein
VTRRVSVFWRYIRIGQLDIGTSINAADPDGEVIGTFATRAAARAALYERALAWLPASGPPLPPPPRRHSGEGVFG